MSPVTRIMIIVALCAGCFFVNLGLLEPDLMEARNFVTAREMIQKDNWLIPTMNDQLRLEKQPMVTWFTALSALAGDTLTDLWIMRLPAAVMATVMVLFFYGLCYELKPRHDFAFLGSAVFATSLLVTQMARVNSWDMYTHAFMVGSIWMQVRGLQSSHNRFSAWFFAAVLMGLSVFSKGPVSLYALWIPFMTGYIIFVDRQQVKRNLKRILLMLLCALIIGFGWYAYLYLVIPEQVSAVLNKETASRVSRHVRPFYFYFHFAAYMGIWAIPMLAALFLKQARFRINESGRYRFLLTWLLTGLLLLSVIPEKKERYMLPLEVPMSLMVAFLFQALSDSMKERGLIRSERLLIKIHGWVVWGIITAMPVLAILVFRKDFLSARYLVAAVLSAAGSVFLFRSLVHAETVAKLRNILVSTTLSMVLLMVFYLPALARLAYKPDFRDVAGIGRTEAYRDIPFVSAGELNMELIWRIGKSVQPLDLIKWDNLSAAPMVFFSYTPIEGFMSPAQREKFHSIPLGTFDCNQDIKSDCEIYVYRIERKN